MCAMLTAKECLQNAEACLALAHKTKELDTRAALLEFAYEFRTVAKCLERDEGKLMVRAAVPTLVSFVGLWAVAVLWAS
jgi:hypothetical protein